MCGVGDEGSRTSSRTLSAGWILLEREALALAIVWRQSRPFDFSHQRSNLALLFCEDQIIGASQGG